MRTCARAWENARANASGRTIDSILYLFGSKRRHGAVHIAIVQTLTPFLRCPNAAENALAGARNNSATTGTYLTGKSCACVKFSRSARSRSPYVTVMGAAVFSAVWGNENGLIRLHETSEYSRSFQFVLKNTDKQRGLHNQFAGLSSLCRRTRTFSADAAHLT